jgi:hypothetical protein
MEDMIKISTSNSIVRKTRFTPRQVRRMSELLVWGEKGHFELEYRKPHFELVSYGSVYYVYLRHGHRRIRVLGKIVENCPTPSGESYTKVTMNFSMLRKLFMSKGISFFMAMDKNLKKTIKEKDWFHKFQKIALMALPKLELWEDSLSKFGNRRRGVALLSAKAYVEAVQRADKVLPE